MADKDTSLPIDIRDEEDSYSAQVDSDRDLHIKSKLWDGTNEVSVTNGKLDVNYTSSTTGSPTRVTTPIHQGDSYNNNRTKISYTVPTGKVLYIQRLWCSHLTDAMGHTIAFKVDTAEFYWMTFNNDGTTTFEKTYPESNPYILTAGEVLTAYKISGSSSESWTSGFDGYLENA